MSYVIFVIISLSFVFSACNGTMNDLSVAALTSCKDAVTLCISLCGTICLWSGIMNVAGKSGIVSGLSRLLSKPLSLLFPDISRKGSADAIYNTKFLQICLDSEMPLLRSA